MSKDTWKPGTMVYPVPAAMITCGDMTESNIITIAWTGTVCTNPAMTYISVRKKRYSYDLIKNSGEFVINLTTQSLVYATDYCGVKSGRDIDKFQQMKLTKEKATQVAAPLIAESPVNIECKVKDIIPLGSHDMFLAEVVAVNIDPQYLDDTGKFRLDLAGIMAYSHGAYYQLGKQLGTFGYSVKKKKNKRKNDSHKKTRRSRKTPRKL